MGSSDLEEITVADLCGRHLGCQVVVGELEGELLNVHHVSGSRPDVWVCVRVGVREQQRRVPATDSVLIAPAALEAVA